MWLLFDRSPKSEWNWENLQVEQNVSLFLTSVANYSDV